MSYSREYSEAAADVAGLIVRWNGLSPQEQSNLMRWMTIGINSPKGLEDALEELFPIAGIVAAAEISSLLQEKKEEGEGDGPTVWPHRPHWDKN